MDPNEKLHAAPGQILTPSRADDSALEHEDSRQYAFRDTQNASAIILDRSNSSDNIDSDEEGSIGDYGRIFQYSGTLEVILYTTAIGCAIISGTTVPLMTVVLGKSTTDFSNIRTSRSDEKINDLVLWFIWLFLARFVFSYIANVLVGIAATRTTRSLRRSFLESTLRQETWYFDKIHGSTATLVTTNATRVQNGIGEKLTAFVQGLSTFFAAFVVALAVQWKLALISMSLVPLLFLLVGGCVSIDAKLEARVMRIYSRAAMLAQDTLGSIRTIHAFGAQAKITRKYDEFLQVAHEEGKKKSVVFGVLFSSEIFLALSSTSLSFWQGYRMFRSNEIPDSGTVFTVALATSIGTLALSLLAPQQQAMSNAASAASELFATIKKKSLLDPLSESGLQPSSCRGQIEVEDLSFVYPQRPAVQVLDHLTISIPAGKTTALVGPSGCGKSTIVALLERWYASNPGTGRITLDGVNLEQYNTKWLRNQIGLVQQEPTLFRGTVFENVAKGFVAAQRDLPREAQMKLVEAACRDSNAHDFITRLPQAYDTQVGERASMLSGGERQRLAIARSIISEPRILLLDEATSALDPAAERLVQSALDRVSVGKTTLIIAHKLATVKAADNIAVMQRGRVVEQGTHEQLIALGGIYATMVRAQDIGAGANDVVRIDHNSESHTDENEKIPVHDPTQAPVLEVAQEEMGRPVTSSLGYSLPKCIGIMLREHRKVFGSFVLNTLGCLIAGGTYPAQAILFSKLIRAFTLPEAEGRAKFFALMFFLMAIANLLAYFVLGWTCNTIGQEVTHKYRAELVECMLDLDMDFFDKPENSVGSLTSRLSSVPTALQELMASNLHLMFVVLVNLVSSSVLGIVYGWRLGLVLVFGGLPVLLGSGYLRIRLDQRFQDDEAGRFAESAGLATEAITSIRTISSLTLEADVLDQYVHSVDQIVERATKYFLIAMIPYALSQSLEFLIFALGLWYGQKLILEDGYTTEQFWVVFIAVVFGGQAAAQFFSYTTSITKAHGAANYILWLRTLKAKITETPQNKNNGPSEGPLEMRDVNFSYAQRPVTKVLSNMSLKIQPGQYVAFVGPSGCGKSTIVSLLERFYDPVTGAITLNNQDIQSMSPSSYRNHLSLVQQEPPLYQGSIRENISLGLQHEPSEDEILESLRQSNGLEFVCSLPEGLNTPCGSKGLQFSGGQKQRIAVARALIRQPRILLLDEATSALDTISERIVQEALNKAASNRTTIAVAHRLSTIKHADVIFVVVNGRIVEQGTHRELQALEGRYYAMCLAQSLDRT